MAEGTLHNPSKIYNHAQVIGYCGSRVPELKMFFSNVSFIPYVMNF